MPTLTPQGYFESDAAFAARRLAAEKADLLENAKKAVAEEDKKFQEKRQKGNVAKPLDFDPNAQHVLGSKTYFTAEKRPQVAAARKLQVPTPTSNHTEHETLAHKHAELTDKQKAEKHAHFLVKFARKEVEPKAQKSADEIKSNYNKWLQDRTRITKQEKEKAATISKKETEAAAARETKLKQYAKNSYERMHDPVQVKSVMPSLFGPKEAWVERNQDRGKDRDSLISRQERREDEKLLEKILVTKKQTDAEQKRNHLGERRASFFSVLNEKRSAILAEHKERTLEEKAENRIASSFKLKP